MALRTDVTIFGYAEAECGPFPCDHHRTCELEDCYPSGRFQDACGALKKALEREYGDRVRLRMVLLDEGIPDDIRSLIEEHHPPVPIVLVDGNLVPLGRISLAHLRKFLNE